VVGKGICTRFLRCFGGAKAEIRPKTGQLGGTNKKENDDPAIQEDPRGISLFPNFRERIFLETISARTHNELNEN